VVDATGLVTQKSSGSPDELCAFNFEELEGRHAAGEEQSAQSLTGIIVRCCLTLGEQFYTDAIGG
jgi:hypothetical protein